MDNITEELKKVIEEVMLPETKDYLEELTALINNNSASNDETLTKEDVLIFIDELNTILNAIKENAISQEDANLVYDKITAMLEEHEEG